MTAFWPKAALRKSQLLANSCRSSAPASRPSSPENRKPLPPSGSAAIAALTGTSNEGISSRQIPCPRTVLRDSIAPSLARMLEVPLSLPLLCLLALALAALSQQAYVDSTPYSGRTGGIARCDEDLFLFNYRPISGSKRSCVAYLGISGDSHEQVTSALQRFAYSFSEFECFCTGPRDKNYCLTRGRRESYMRK